MRMRYASLAIMAALLAPSAEAAIITVDLSGALSGTFIDGLGADFAGTFAGQSIVGGSGISGSPTNPLTLLPSNTLLVAFWNPVVSGASNSILPDPGNQGPLSALLDTDADSVTWTMGSADGGSVTVGFFNASGGLVNTIVQPLSFGYNVYSFLGVGTFRGFTIYDNNDPAGLRFQNFEYNSVETPVPEPGTLMLLGLGLGALRLRRPKGL